MPIITKDETPGFPSEGVGQTEGACINCHGKIKPCACRLIDGEKCQPPFKGWLHDDTGSHVCGFPAPGAKVAEPE